MTRILTAEEAEAQFKEILNVLQEGQDDVIVTRNGFAVARLVPMSANKSGETTPDIPLPHPRTPGRDKGKFVIPDSFYEPMTEEELKEWGL